MTFKKCLYNFIIAGLLVLVFILALFSMKDDSLTMDEVAHLPAGYSYLTQKDMRLNPEHPPLLKDLAAFPLLFIQEIRFPYEIKDWQEDINGQWGFGYHFLYHMGNPTEKMIFWARIPMILLLCLLGFYIFRFAKEFFGKGAALLALFFFAFSPTFLAHGRLVTTDVGAAFGVVFATFYFLKALKSPSKKNILLAGFALGIAELLKFSLILLIPFFFLVSLFWWLLKLGKGKEIIKVLLAILILYLIVVWLVYFYHTLNYPPQRQLRDTQFLLSSFSGGPLSLEKACLKFGSLLELSRCPAEIVIWASDKPILRSLAHYGLGLLMVFQRASGGHTTYFLGEVSASGWKTYFPFVYIIKEPLAFHLLTLIVLLYLAYLVKRPFWKEAIPRLKECLKKHFVAFCLFLWLIIYWATSIKSSLNIGVRHLLPVFPFTFILVGVGTTYWLKKSYLKIKYLILGFLLLWQAISVLSTYPHFLAYANEIIGGPDHLYLYTVDSNLDWGQDLKRLEKWVNKKGIEKIYVDYFGGGDAKFYLKERFLPWSGTKKPEEFEKGNYLAVSATFLQGGRGLPVPGFDQPWGHYLWLLKYEPPVAKIGYSIFVYYID